MEKNNSKLEKRMYFLVLYSLSGIQKAIQAGHAALEYAHLEGQDKDYIDFIENWKTWIILNGGTTNSNFKSLGTLNQSLEDLVIYNIANPENLIKFSIFHEPDLNNALTAICLVVDERVFNREDYPDFKEWATDLSDVDYYEKTHNMYYEKYVKVVGEDIAFLKELLNTKKLA